MNNKLEMVERARAVEDAEAVIAGHNRTRARARTTILGAWVRK